MSNHNHDHHSHSHDHAHGPPEVAMASTDGPSRNMSEEEKEQKHFEAVLRSFRRYKFYSDREVGWSERDLKRLSPLHQKALCSVGYVDKLRRRKESIEINAEFLSMVVGPTFLFANDDRTQTMDKPDDGLHVSPMDRDKVRSTLRQFVRDWSEEGKEERTQCYDPLLATLEKNFPLPFEERGKVRVLVPGAGLGRLAYEVVSRGYSCEGNEFSYHMLLASNWVLNRTAEMTPLSHVIRPYAHQVINVRKDEDMFRDIRVPDIVPNRVPRSADFSMSGGDFLVVYDKENDWDCVLTCFFIDTAHNIVEYLERIYHMLKPGGMWINLGPLLYHYADDSSQTSIELSWESLRQVIQLIGFELKSEEWTQASYAHNQKSMMKYVYDCVHTVAVKPRNPMPSRVTSDGGEAPAPAPSDANATATSSTEGAEMATSANNTSREA